MGYGLSQGIPYIIYAAAIVAMLLTIFSKVEYGALFLIPLLPLQNLLQKVYLLPYGTQFIDFFILAMLIGWFFQRASEGLLSPSSFTLPVFAYACLTCAGLWYGAEYVHINAPSLLLNPRVADWKNLMILPLLYFIVLNNVRDYKTTKRLSVLMLASVLVASFVFYKEFRNVQTWHYSHDIRVEGTFTYLGPNEFGAFCVMYSAIAYALLLRASTWRWRAFYGLVAMAGTYGTLYSYSRAAYMAWVIATAFLLVTWKKWTIIVLVLFGLSATAFLPVSVIERIQMTEASQDTVDSLDPTTDPNALDPSAQGRFDIWQKAFDLWKTSPIVGTGYDTFAYFGVEGTGRLDTHNNFLKTLAESGIIGFGIYLYMYFLAFTHGWGLYRTAQDPFARALGVGFAACVLANIFVNLTHDNWSYLNLMAFYWTFLAIVDSLRRQAETNPGEVEEAAVAAEPEPAQA